jgi:type I restriction-modification system DNA methylase subunit
MALQKRFNFGRAGTLFNEKTIKRALTKFHMDPTEQQLKAAKDWAAQVRHPKFRAKETSVRGEFIQKVPITILGYKPYRAGETYTIATEEALGKGAVDTALGTFSDSQKGGVLAPFELKGPKTVDLDAIMPGRNKSPVQQAWEYAIDAPGAKWVLVSNCAEIRLYAFGHGREHYETWDLGRLDDPQVHERLWLLIGAQNLLSGRTAELLEESANKQKDITFKLYEDYKKTRDTLIQTLQDQPPRLAALTAIEHAQTILDRVLFIAFAESTALLPERLIYKAWDQKSPFRPNGAWENFVGLFEAVDQGNPALDIPAYNGGLFAKNAIIDALGLSNFVCENFAKIADYDFSSDVPVSVLGHVFEQSVSDIEKLRAEAQGQTPPKTSKRKREGVVYTPDFVTRFIVEETIGKTLSERFAAVLGAHGVVEANSENGPVYSWTPEIELSVWRDYRQELRNLTIIDPACGSGAFLIAAFDYLEGEYKRVAERLKALGDKTESGDVDREILVGNLHGVDLNPEPVEITKLSLWLKTAKRGKVLQDLDASIKCGNSLIADKNEHGRAFDWRAEFPEIFARGGFDIVLGNPPYVRMETIKPFKPYLEKQYAVASDRADLYAYFYEKGFELLRPGGRLGYISSSTFMRTGSGENLRHFLRTRAEIENLVDFGDLQIFEGVTTYPAIVTMRQASSANENGQHGDLRFLNIKSDVPKDLARTFRAAAQAMPRARLGDGSWQFEGDMLAALRAKIKAPRKTLGELYGAPLRGIVTGLNEAFIVSRERRDELVRRDARSADLLVPFLRGENIKRWRIESEDLFLINIPKGKVRIEDYPAIRDHLLPFKDKLEARATKQEWFELQQAQLAYQPKFLTPKISYGHFAQNRIFAFDHVGFFSNDKSYLIPNAEYALLAYLNSRLAWFYIVGLSPAVRGGFHEMRVHYIEQVPISKSTANLEKYGANATKFAGERLQTIQLVLRRIPDLCPSRRAPKLTNRLQEWWKLDFKSFQAEIKKSFKADIPLKRRNEWEIFLREEGEKVRRLTAEIEQAEREIDAIVYKLFDLTPDEIALLENSLAGQY